MAPEEKKERWRRSKGNGAAAVECYNCGCLGHTQRVCTSDCYTCGRDCPCWNQKKIVGTKKMGDNIHNNIPPQDICREILLLLPPVSLIRFRSVSKTWQSIIDDPSFVKAHTHKQQQKPSILLRNSSSALYTFDLETLIPTNGSQTIPASTLNLAPSVLPRLSCLPVVTCNGLMLIPPHTDEFGQTISGHQTWEIWNTLTQERLELELSPQNMHYNRLVGLGYDRASDDYKVVEIVGKKRTSSFVLLPHVYSLKSNTWRTKTDFPHSMWNIPLGGECAFVCGALHWISSDSGQHFYMFSFHVGTETLREFKPPPGLGFRRCSNFMIRDLKVDVLDGCLAVSDYGDQDDGLKEFDIWVMKEYGVEDSWALLYKLPAFYSPLSCLFRLRPVAACLKDKRQILMQDDQRLYLFDVEKNSSKVVDIQGFSGDIVTARVFHGSIFRLHDNCVVTAAAKRRRRREKTKKSEKNIVDTKLLFRVRDFRFVSPDPS